LRGPEPSLVEFLPSYHPELAAMMYRNKKMVIDRDETAALHKTIIVIITKRTFIFFFSAPFDDSIYIIDNKFHDHFRFYLPI